MYPFHIQISYREMNYIKLVNRLLLRIFIEKEVNLHTFKVIMLSSEDYEYFNDTEFVTQNPNFICNIRNLTLILIYRTKIYYQNL
jgi:hypothetical protein